MMIDLNPYHLEIVTQILVEHVPDCEVRAFGSRATWTSKDYSDLDLAIVSDKPLKWRTLGKLRDAFEESYLPMRVDVLDWHDISDKFREMIREDCIVIFKNGSTHDWKKLTLKQCIEMEVSNYSEKEAWPFINYLDTGNITMNIIKEIQHLVVGRDKVPTRARRKIKPGDIVYSMVRPNQRHFGLIKHPPENFLVSTGFAVLRGKPGIAHTDFIYYLLAQEHIVDYLQAIAENSTSAYPSIRPHDLEQLEIQLPSLPKQRDIAHILGTLDEKIELNRRMNETLEEMAQALFKSWFIDFDPVRAKIEGRWQPGESLPGLPAYLYDLLPNRLVPSELGEVPEGWQVKSLGDIARQRKCQVESDQLDSNISYIALNHMPKNSISLSEWANAASLGSNKLRFSKYDILFGKLRPYFHKVGVAPIDGVCSTDIVVIYPLASQWFGFVLFHTCSKEFINYTTATSTGTRMPRSNWNDMAQYRTVVPTNSTATVFNELINSYIQKLLIAIEQSHALINLRNIMLLRFFGRHHIRVDLLS